MDGFSDEDLLSQDNTTTSMINESRTSFADSKSRPRLLTRTEILDAYEEKLEFKDDKEMVIENVSRVGLAKFARHASKQTIDSALNTVAWKTLGYLNDENGLKEVPDNPEILFSSASDILKSGIEKLDMDCPLFNQVLNGGLKCGTVTEITGESGSGKSQVCLHAASVQAVQGNPVIFLQTESSFPLSRLSQIILERSETEEEINETMNRIFIKKIQSYSHMLSVLNKDIEALIKDRGVKLLIIDSITAIIRGDKDIEDVGERTEILHSVGSKLQVLCNKYKISVVVVNQVSSAIDYPGHTYGRKVIPSLGPMWTTFINTRLFVSKTDFKVSKELIPGLPTDSSLRTLQVDFSSFLGEEHFNFLVTPAGIMGVNITE